MASSSESSHVITLCSARPLEDVTFVARPLDMDGRVHHLPFTAVWTERSLMMVETDRLLVFTAVRLPLSEEPGGGPVIGSPSAHVAN